MIMKSIKNKNKLVIKKINLNIIEAYLGASMPSRHSKIHTFSERREENYKA